MSCYLPPAKQCPTEALEEQPSPITTGSTSTREGDGADNEGPEAKDTRTEEATASGNENQQGGGFGFSRMFDCLKFFENVLEPLNLG